jgi:hypothetical protein
MRAEAKRPVRSDPDAYVLQNPYSNLLRSLTGAQLKLESHRPLIEGNKSQYPEPSHLIKHLSAAESYLGHLVTEWEAEIGRFVIKTQDNNLKDFPILRCFVSKASRSFNPMFA